MVTGLPASGKTALARLLSPALGLPLLSKDVVKEVHFDTLGIRDRGWSLQLSIAATNVVFSLLPDCPCRTRSWRFGQTRVGTSRSLSRDSPALACRRQSR